jgi:hypothetical protein
MNGRRGISLSRLSGTSAGRSDAPETHGLVLSSEPSRGPSDPPRTVRFDSFRVSPVTAAGSIPFAKSSQVEKGVKVGNHDGRATPRLRPFPRRIWTSQSRAAGGSSSSLRGGSGRSKTGSWSQTGVSRRGVEPRGGLNRPANRGGGRVAGLLRASRRASGARPPRRACRGPGNTSPGRRSPRRTAGSRRGRGPVGR